MNWKTWAQFTRGQAKQCSETPPISNNKALSPPVAAEFSEVTGVHTQGGIH
jgi:hypothetical protein